jgi:uncharacterized repeat protein (TIGR01451 family)
LIFEENLKTISPMLFLSLPSRFHAIVTTLPLFAPPRRGFFARAATFIALVALLFPLGGTALADSGRANYPARPSDPRIPPAQIFGLPMQFEKNEGQTDTQVQFLSRGPGYTVFLTSTQAVLSLRSANSALNQADLQMNLVGSNPNARIEGIDELPGKTSYFIGSDPKNWHADLPTFAQVRYRQVYPGIDLLYYGNQRQLEYDFVVAPKANARRIALNIDGAERLEVNSQGDLVAYLNGAQVSWHRPVAYQVTDGGRKEIPARFTLKKNQQVGFQIAAYDTTKPLIIDPALVYATYLGGAGDEVSFTSFAPSGIGVAVDTNGNVYVVGQTTSRNFPTRNAYRSTAYGTDTNLSDVFITKLNSAGNALIYSTYIGGASNDVAGGIAVDSAGNVYITGSTESLDFPHINAAQSANNGFDDIFVTKLASNGTSIVYSTFLGGACDDFGRAIAVDTAGSAYVTGTTCSKGTGSSPFPTTQGAFQTQNGDSAGNTFDAFVAKFSSTGARVYCTFLGGKTDEEGNAIAVDSSGNALVVGEIDASADYDRFGNRTPPQSDFPVLNAFQPLFNTGNTDSDFISDGFVTKLNATGTARIFSTFLGGNDQDAATGIAVDAKGRACVTGSTSSVNFPSTANSAQPANAGAADNPDFPGSDAFITIFETNGTSLVYSTYLGGTLFEEGGINLSRFGIAVDKFGDVYVVGQTSSYDFPLTPGADQIFSEAINDVFVAKLNPAVPGPAGLIYSTLLSGNFGVLPGGAYNEAESIAVDASGNFYVAGLTTATNFPVTPGAFASTNGGGFNDAFVAKFSSPRDLSVTMLASAEPVTVGSNITYTIKINNNGRSTFTGVTNIVEFPTNVPILSFSSTAGSSSTNGGRVILNIGTMTNNASITQTIVIGTSATGAITNTATLNSLETPTQEPNISNNVATVVSHIRGFADVSITGFGLPNPVMVTSNMSYVLRVSNAGPYPASSVILTDVLPPSMAFLSAASSQGACTYDGVTVTCDFGSLPTNTIATVSIIAKAVTNGVATNLATVTSFEADSKPSNNSSSIITTINPLTDLSIGQNGPAAAFVGSNLTYTLTIRNLGPSPSANTAVSDILPENVLYKGTYPQTNGIVTITLGSLASNGVATVPIIVQALLAGPITNFVTVTNSAGIDLVSANNSASFTTTIYDPADLEVSQVVSPNSTTVLSNVTITVTVLNHGFGTATGAVVTDALPPSLALLSIQSPPGAACAQTNGVITCNLGALTNSDSATLTFQVQANSDGTFTNTAAVTAASDPSAANNSASATLTVAPNPDAPLLKVSRTGANVILSWSTNAVPYALQSNTNLSASSMWAPVTNALVQAGNQFTVTIPIAGTNTFYRLNRTLP